MADYNSTFTGAQIDTGITKANSAQQPPVEGPFVDGDKTKLDGIEAGADVTDTASVTAAGALMDSEVTNLAAVKAFDPTDYATAAQGGLADTAVQPGDDASTLGSGAATDGYVLTADGVGGAAWEVASGGGADDYIRTRAGSIQDLFNMADTWNDGATTFIAIKMDVTDTASAAGSLLMDLQVGGSSKFRVKKDGTFSATPGEAAAPTMSFANDDDSGLNFSATYIEFVYSGTTRGIAGVDDGAAMFKLPDSGFFGWSPNAAVPSTSDLRLYRDAAGTLAQRNFANAQTFNIYNTYTDASNYERGFMKWNANEFQIGAEAAGAGTARQAVLFGKVKAIASGGILVEAENDTVMNYPTANKIGFWAGGNDVFSVTSSGVDFAADVQVKWTSGGYISGVDSGIARVAPAQLRITNGSTGTGELIFIVPTSDPGITGALWNNAGTLSISA